MEQSSIDKSFGYAWQGILHAIRENRNLKIHLVAGVLVIIASFILKVTHEDFLVLMVMIIFVIASEMINTALEEMTDLITTEHRKEAKAAKDVAAGMVFVTAIGAALIGIIIFLPYLLTFFNY